VLVPRYPGVLSAFGMLNADRVKDFSVSALRRVADLDAGAVDTLFAPLIERARAAMAAEGVTDDRLELRLSADMRYAGQSYELTVLYDGLAQTVARFHAAHMQRFSHADERLSVELVTLRVKAVGNRRFSRCRNQPSPRRTAMPTSNATV
jgi:N-methylhydantoinase A